MDNKEQIKLHLGCGTINIPGYRNIDCRHLPTADEIGNIKYLKGYKPNSVDVIYACAVLEHFIRWEYKDVLRRWYEVLKPGGILRISVPDWEALVSHYNEHKNLRILMGMLYGGSDYAENFHYVTFDFKTLSEDLYDLGFKKVYRYDWRETDHAHIDDFSQAYLPHLDKTNGRLMHLNVEGIKG